MLPLDPLGPTSDLARLLRRAPAEEVLTEIERLAALPGSAARAAAIQYARGALALRQGELDAAHDALIRAAASFDAQGERAAADLARCEALRARLRRGPRAACAEIAAELEGIARNADGEEASRVWVVATHYRGLVERRRGQGPAARRALYAALKRAASIKPERPSAQEDPRPGLPDRTAGSGAARAPSLDDERGRVLVALGALYVELGAYAAAEALLQEAAELCHRCGDAFGEASASGELGAVAIGLGDLERARLHFGRQERLCAGLGDALGRARALAMMADAALELGHPSDALAMASSARDLAGHSSSPLRLWTAHAGRVLGRARRALEGGDAGAAERDAAAALFAELGDPVGAALAAWDRAHAAAQAGAAFRLGSASAGAGTDAAWFHAAWALASLGHGARVAQLLRDHAAGRDGGVETQRRTFAVVAQTVPRVAAQQEEALAYERPDALAAIASRRAAASRNLGRLAALTLAPPGLLVAAIASLCAGTGGVALPPQRAAAACAAVLPELTVWIWPASTPLPEVGRDLAALRVALGEDARAALDLAPEGRVLSPPFAGEAGPELHGVSLSELLAAAPALPPGALRVDPRLAWSGEAEARVVMAGYATQR